MENFVINIGRQLGSCGKKIAEQLAEELGVNCYDKRLLDLAAQESGFAKELFEDNDENKGLLKNLMHMRFLFGTTSGDSSFFPNVLSEESLFRFQSEAIRKCASKESCIFIGRCADYILRDHPRCVNLFIAADREERIRTLSERRNLSLEKAEKALDKEEGNRKNYYNFYTGKKWGNSSSYDLCINISKMGYDKSFQFILAYVKASLNLTD